MLIAIIEAFSSEYSKYIPNSQRIVYNEPLLNDVNVQKFVDTELKNITPDLIVIEANLLISGMSYWGFRIGMHIRLSRELGEKRYTPIIFIAEEDFDTILTANVEATLATTKGCKVVGSDLLNRAIAMNLPIADKSFLQNIIVPKTEKVNRHSIANIWGAMRLAEITGTTIALTKEMVEKKTTIYFKYIEALYEKTDDKIGDKKTGEIKIPAPNKRILLIDDQADDGWSEILQHIFEGADFHVPKTKEEVNSNEKWDLILLDLRLIVGEDADASKKPSEFSGVKLLQDIKDANRGTQVIMLTASNKAWNMKELLDLGADGYYIKESPESGFSYKMSLENYESFKKQAEDFLKRGYLRETFEKHMSNSIAVYKPNLDIAFELLYKYAQTKQEKYLNYTFLTYYQVLEMYANDWTNQGENIVSTNFSFHKENLSVAGSYGYYQKNTTGKGTINKKSSITKISYTLAFKVYKDDICLKDVFGKLNYLRNGKAAHGGNNFVDFQDVIAIRDLVIEMLQA